jgi:nucleoside phosphorylase
MRRPLKLQENPEVSCAVLAHFIAKETDQHRRWMLMKDFLTKSQNISRTETVFLALQIVLPVLPEEEKEFMSSIVQEAAVETKPKADVIIITVLQEELRAVQAAFDISPNTIENRSVDGLRFWETRVANEYINRDLNVVITMIGQSRNVECAATCSKIFTVYNADLCVLVGIAAGVKDKVKLGDVVVAEEVLDYEGARRETGGDKKRPKPYSLEIEIRRHLGFFNPLQRNWHELLKESLQNIPELSVLADWQPEYHEGVILAGEKLLADGSLPAMREEYHEKVRAAEQEGSGFARICQEYSIPWLVFRGVSDYGDPSKPETKPWRLPSVVAAATAVKAFIMSDYRKKTVKF